MMFECIKEMVYGLGKEAGNTDWSTSVAQENNRSKQDYTKLLTKQSRLLLTACFLMMGHCITQYVPFKLKYSCFA